MNWINVEIKAKSNDNDTIEKILLARNADYKGLDHQIDTYFNVPNGRLKLREGNIEHALIQYNRTNQSGPKISDITYYKPKDSTHLKKALLAALGKKVVVDKKRKIFFIDNVKFHLDTVLGLGTFCEIEAIDKYGKIGLEKLQEQCQYYIDLFQIQSEDLVSVSYSDLLLQNNG